MIVEFKNDIASKRRAWDLEFPGPPYSTNWGTVRGRHLLWCPGIPTLVALSTFPRTPLLLSISDSYLNRRRPGCTVDGCRPRSLCDLRVGNAGVRVCMKSQAPFRRMRTGGVYLTVDGDARSGNRIVELMEMLGTEDNALEETSLSDVCARFGSLSLWMRDYVCSCAFADAMVRKNMSGRFHARNHTRQVCRTKYNPPTSANSRIRNRLCVWNTVSCEQTFRYFRY